jgi:hypothetical protein
MVEGQRELADAAKKEAQRAFKAAVGRIQQLTNLKASDEDLHTATTASLDEVIATSTRLYNSTAQMCCSRTFLIRCWCTCAHCLLPCCVMAARSDGAEVSEDRRRSARSEQSC